VAIAVTLAGDQVTTARIVLGGVAPVPWRAAAAERAVIGKRLDAATARAAAEAAVEGAVPLDHNGYKVPLVMGVVEESVLALA
jgi:xanthine dehydrogenase YagS FAD-binding subunit